MPLFDRRNALAGLSASMVTGFSGPALAAVRATSSLDWRLRAYLAPYIAARDFSGVVLVAQGRQVRFKRSFGFADFEWNTPNQPNSRFNIGSVAKLFTYATFNALRNQGRMSADDALAKWLPTFPKSDKITIRMLLNHQAGLSKDPSGFETLQLSPHTTAEMVEIISRDPFISEPGAQVAYSNNGYRLLARVIELVTGRPYHGAVDDLVLRPNGLMDTGPLFGPQLVLHLAKGYQVQAAPRSLAPARYQDMSNYIGASSFYSTADDLLKLTTILPAPAAPAPGAKGPTHVGHDGLVNGFFAVCYRYAPQDWRLIFLSNIESGLFGNIEPDLQAMIYGESPSPFALPVFSSMPAAATLQQYAGDYSIGPKAVMKVRLSDDGGMTVDGGDGATPLSFVSQDRFFLRLRYAYLNFDNVQGRITGVKWEQGGSAFDCPRSS